MSCASQESGMPHRFVVFSTAVQDGVLLVECNECGRVGIVPDPTREEWSKAFTAPSQPYDWSDNARVKLLRPPPPGHRRFVQPAAPGRYAPSRHSMDAR